MINKTVDSFNGFDQTVEAEITSIMTSQRARGAESRAGNKSANGPRRAQGTAKAKYLRRRTRVSCRGYVSISQVHGLP